MNSSTSLPRENTHPAHWILKPWHVLKARLLARQIRRQHRELAKFVRRSAYEISAWKQDIGFLEEQLEHHLCLSGSPSPILPDVNKVVSIEEAAAKHETELASKVANRG